MGAYKRNVFVVIKMGAYIHGVLILCGCLLSRFYGIRFKQLIMTCSQDSPHVGFSIQPAVLFFLTCRYQVCWLTTVSCWPSSLDRYELSTIAHHVNCKWFCLYFIHFCSCSNPGLFACLYASSINLLVSAVYKDIEAIDLDLATCYYLLKQYLEMTGMKPLAMMAY